MTDDPPALALSVPGNPVLEIAPYMRGSDLVIVVNARGRCIGRFILEGLADAALDPSTLHLGDHHFIPGRRT